MILLYCAMASAAEYHLVRTGETLESIAAQLGDPSLAGQLRLENAITGEPQVGTLLRLPASIAGIDQDGEVLSTSGPLTLTVSGGPAVRVRVGARLQVGSTVCTGPGGFATVRLSVGADRGHDDITLMPDTCLTVDSATSRVRRSALVSVGSGSVSVRSSTLGDLAVRTASGVTAGRNGGFRVAIEPGASRTEAIGASAAVIGAGVEVSLRKNQGSRVKTGEAPSPPVDLLFPGTPIEPVSGTRLVRPDFKWTPAERALGYRIEIATDPEFSELIRIQEVSKSPWLPSRLLVPYRVEGLWWRVATFDRTGFLGAPSEPNELLFPPGVGP